MLNEGRIGIAAQMVGLAEGVLEQSEPFFTDKAKREVSVKNTWFYVINVS